jgi:hypothetical protein
MTEQDGVKANVEVGTACGVGREGIKCAVVSWVAPLVAVLVLVAGLYYPVVSVFNILFVAFGITALLRSGAHIRRYGRCGLGGHVALGVALNLAIVVLVAVYFFTAFDPLGIRPAP